MSINIINLAKECQKNPSLINICKGHSQSLCKLALQQSGYTNGLDKWHGRYCFVIKHLLKIINKSGKKVKLSNGKKILDIIKKEKLKVPQDVQRFIQKNSLNQLGNGPETPETPYNDVFKDLSDTPNDILKYYVDTPIAETPETPFNAMFTSSSNTLAKTPETPFNAMFTSSSNTLAKTPETPFNAMFTSSSNTLPKSKAMTEIDQILSDLDKINELQHRTNVMKNNLPDDKEQQLRQKKKLDAMHEELQSLLNKSKSRKIISSDYDVASFFDDKFSGLIDNTRNWHAVYKLLEEEKQNPSGSVSIEQLKNALKQISPYLLESFQSIPRDGSINLEPQVIGKAKSYFNPEKENEIFIDKDDIIKISSIYSNGKAYGEVLYTKKHGFFPLTVFM